ESGVQDVDYEIDQIVTAQQNGFDFGNFPNGNVTGFKYVDSNNNGHLDPGELPIQGVIITLTGTNDLGQPVNIQTTTQADGSFTFPGLRPSNAAGYTLTETPPINFIVGKAAVGTVNGVQVGSVAASQLVITGIILTPTGLSGVDYTFGELGLKPPYVSKR